VASARNNAQKDWNAAWADGTLSEDDNEPIIRYKGITNCPAGPVKQEKSSRFGLQGEVTRIWGVARGCGRVRAGCPYAAFVAFSRARGGRRRVLGASLRCVRHPDPAPEHPG
jgi:hypothetical protein